MRLTIEGTDEIFTSNGGLAVAGKLVKSGGRTMLKISRKCPWFDPFERLFASYC